jgi:hypothetical protein
MLLSITSRGVIQHAARPDNQTATLMNERAKKRPIVKRIDDRLGPHRRHDSSPEQPASMWVRRAVMIAIVFATIGIAEAIGKCQRGQTLIEFAAK